MYKYKVFKSKISSIQEEILNKLPKEEQFVISSYSPKEIKKMYCCDFQFPNGDTFSLESSQVRLNSVEILNIE